MNHLRSLSFGLFFKSLALEGFINFELKLLFLFITFSFYSLFFYKRFTNSKNAKMKINNNSK